MDNERMMADLIREATKRNRIKLLLLEAADALHFKGSGLECLFCKWGQLNINSVNLEAIFRGAAYMLDSQSVCQCEIDKEILIEQMRLALEDVLYGNRSPYRGNF